MNLSEKVNEYAETNGVTFDGMCSTIRQAYRKWERQQKGEAKA